MKSHLPKSIAVALSAIVLTGSMTFAHETTNQRQKNQQKRIRQGVKSGELTRHETRKLEREQTHIQRDKMKAKSDGDFTPAERAKIQREQNRASRDIYRQKHDNQER